jgi:hypothetical protein
MVLFEGLLWIGFTNSPSRRRMAGVSSIAQIKLAIATVGDA